MKKSVIWILWRNVLGVKLIVISVILGMEALSKVGFSSVFYKVGLSFGGDEVKCWFLVTLFVKLSAVSISPNYF